MKTALGNLAPLPGNNEKPHMVDVVLHLGRNRRFGGWANQEWSGLHHSVLATFLYSRCFGADSGALDVLLHDGHEYITGDIPTPVKRLLGDGVDGLEAYLDRLLREMLTLAPDMSDVMKRRVKVCDFAALIIESFHFGERSLPLSHVGETGWRKLSEALQRDIAFVVHTCAPEVYAAMMVDQWFNPTWVANPWGVR